MDNFLDIKNTWLTADVSALPGADEMVKAIKKYRTKNTLQNAALIILILLMAATMIRVVFMYKSTMLTTRLGEACFFVAMFILLSTKLGSLKRIAAQKNKSNTDFINFLKQEQQHQIYFFKNTQIIGFSFSVVGLMLYIFEAVHNDVNSMLIGYSLLVLFFLAGWFILRPIAIKRKTKKLNDVIKKMEEFSSQLSHN